MIIMNARASGGKVIHCLIVINYNYISKIHYKLFFWYVVYPHHHIINMCHISTQTRSLPLYHLSHHIT
jgi:hypothetical protein